MRPVPGDYGDAFEFFSAVRDAAMDAQARRARLERMEAGEGLRGAGGFDARVRSTKADPSGMARVDARIDYESLTARRDEEDWALIDLACELIYGRGNESGVESLMGRAVADCLYFRFVAAESWHRVSQLMGVSVRQAQRYVEQGLDGVDYYGCGNLALAADGLAQG